MVASLDLYYLLVENVFGSIWITGVALAAAIWLIGMWSKMSPFLMIVLTGTFLMVFTIGIVGGIGVTFWLLLAIYYLWTGVKNWQNSGRD